MTLIQDHLTNGLYDQLDDMTVQAILAIQIQDLAEVQGGDAALAATLLKENLEVFNSSIIDRRITRSIADAVVQDGTLLTTYRQEEAVAQQDRALATSLQGRRNVRVTTQPVPEIEVDEELLAKLAGIHMSEKAGRKLLPTSEEDGSQGALFPRAKRHTCEACDEDVSYFKVFKAPCDHEYCGDCVYQLFDKSLTDETLFPPRCCRQVIPIDSKCLALFLNKDMRVKYEERKAEMETTDRVYCSNASCSAFIMPKTTIKGVAKCSKCQNETCSCCKKASHEGSCKKDSDLKAIMDVVQSAGWQICSRCGHAVELNEGCHHMT
jgi:hypothetical protein